MEGFRDYQLECFEIHEAVVDSSNWNEGFETLQYQESEDQIPGRIGLS